MAGRDWKRLAAYVVHDRVARGYKTRGDLASATKVTERTLGNLERGQSVGASTLSAVEAVLHWVPGSAAATLDGGQPTYADVPPPGRSEESRDELVTIPVDEFVARFRGAESVYLQDGDRAGADRWLRRVLTDREEHIRQQMRANANSDGS